MAENSKIAWTDNTFNPVWGCAKVGPGCDNCYAEAQANRFGNWWGVGNARREFGEKHWNEPLKWNRQAEKTGKRIKVFCASMADVFDKNWPEGTRERLWDLIRNTPHLDWQLVTKRIGNAKKMLPPDWGNGYPNVWLLITVVNQEEVDRDIPKLLDVPAAVRGLSIEPQLGPITFRWAKWSGWNDGSGATNNQYDGLRMLDWVICGAESGSKRRPFELDWARSLRNQCQAAGTAFFLKQIPGGDGSKGVIETPELDGRQWLQFPNEGQT